MIIRKYLTEMPYIRYGKAPEDIIDLELELKRNPWKFVRFMISIFNGKEVKDKYGNIIHLQTAREKEKFANEIRNNSQYIWYINKYLPKWLYKRMDRIIRSIIRKSRGVQKNEPEEFDMNNVIGEY